MHKSDIKGTAAHPSIWKITSLPTIIVDLPFPPTPTTESMRSREEQQPRLTVDKQM